VENALYIIERSLLLQKEPYILRKEHQRVQSNLWSPSKIQKQKQKKEKETKKTSASSK